MVGLAAAGIMTLSSPTGGHAETPPKPTATETSKPGVPGLGPAMDWKTGEEEPISKPNLQLLEELTFDAEGNLVETGFSASEEGAEYDFEPLDAGEDAGKEYTFDPLDTGEEFTDKFSHYHEPLPKYEKRPANEHLSHLSDLALREFGRRRWGGEYNKPFYPAIDCVEEYRMYLFDLINRIVEASNQKRAPANRISSWIPKAIMGEETVFEPEKKDGLMQVTEVTKVYYLPIIASGIKSGKIGVIPEVKQYFDEIGPALEQALIEAKEETKKAIAVEKERAGVKAVPQAVVDRIARAIYYKKVAPFARDPRLDKPVLNTTIGTQLISDQMRVFKDPKIALYAYGLGTPGTMGEITRLFADEIEESGIKDPRRAYEHLLEKGILSLEELHRRVLEDNPRLPKPLHRRFYTPVVIMHMTKDLAEKYTPSGIAIDRTLANK